MHDASGALFGWLQKWDRDRHGCVCVRAHGHVHRQTGREHRLRPDCCAVAQPCTTLVCSSSSSKSNMPYSAASSSHAVAAITALLHSVLHMRAHPHHAMLQTAVEHASPSALLGVDVVQVLTAPLAHATPPLASAPAQQIQCLTASAAVLQQQQQQYATRLASTCNHLRRCQRVCQRVHQQPIVRLDQQVSNFAETACWMTRKQTSVRASQRFLCSH